MRILYLTDPHGSLDHYQAAFTAALERRADLLLLGGDLCPDRLNPAEQAGWVRTELAPLFAGFGASGGCPAAGVTGNHDTVHGAAALAEMAGFALVNSATAGFGKAAVSGLALTPPSPFPVVDFDRRDLRSSPSPDFGRQACYFSGGGPQWQTMGEAEYFNTFPSIEEELERLPIAAPSRTIFIAHGPPDGGLLDHLKGDIFCGSVAVRRYLERWQPAVSLHGHVHESPFMSGHCSQKIGSRLAINPGQTDDRPVWACFDLEDLAGTWSHSLGLKL